MSIKTIFRSYLVRLSTSLIIVVVFQIPLIKPFFHSGFFPTHDGVQTVRIFEYYQGLRYGQFPPRWSSGLLYGYGYPLFIFYGPFSYLLGPFFVFGGATFLLATKLAFILGFFVGSIGMFFLIRHLVSNLAAIFSALLYSLIPYRAVEVYVRGDLAEFLAFSLFPWIFLINLKLLKSPRNHLLTATLGLLFSSLIITHNLSAFIYFAFLIPFNLFYIFMYERKNSSTVVSSFLISGIIALLISCFYWLPLVIESRFVQLSKFADYPYAQYFVTFSKLWQSPWGYGGFIEKAPMSLQFGQTILIVSFLTFILNSIIKTKNRSLIFFLSTALVFFTLLETKVSVSIWNNLGLIHYLQFPWRFHILTTTVGAVLVGLFFHLLNYPKFINSKANFTLTLVCGTVFVFSGLRESFIFFTPKFFSSEPVVSETTTWNDEYLPTWVKSKPKDYASDKTTLLAPHGKIDNIKWGYGKTQFRLDDNQANQTRIAQVFYPGWQAFVNNQATPIIYDNPQGLMTIETLPGKSEIKFIFTKTWWRWLADFASVIGVVLLLILTTSGLRHLKSALLKYRSS